MTLASGTKLAHYEIVEPIGKGGMGEVYRARDTKLGREVAIKVLPDELSKDRERLARFEREAKLLASLNHPAIATLYGFEDDFLVMELVEGETLAERIARGPIPVDEVIALFTQIADGLEAAHEKGIIHRDLKPANIKITPGGQIKILDFGLAKAFSAEQDVSAETSQSPTLTKGTALGTIMGTASYMSPEQARGKAVDKRTDVWAFGCCVFEALTAKKVFEGETVTDIIAAVVKNEPGWERLPENTPRAIGHLVKRCLEKDRRQRLRDIGEARIVLGTTSSDPDALSAIVVPHTHPASGSPPLWALAVLLVGALLGGLGVYYSQIDPPSLRLRKHRFPAAVQRDHKNHTVSVISPDGDSVAFIQNKRLWIRELDQVEAREVSDTEGATRPFWSPDSRSIGYFVPQTRELETVDVGGQSTRILTKLPNAEFGGASWGSTGTIVFSRSTKGLFEVAASGSEPTLLLEPDRTRGEVQLQNPLFLPEGRGLLVTAILEDYGFLVLRCNGQKCAPMIRFEADIHGTYSPSGHLLYHYPFGQPGIWALPISIVDGSVTGEAFRIHEDGRCPSVSSDGTLIYASAALERLVWANRSGTVEGTIGQPQDQIADPDVSPDGLFVAVTAMENGNRDIWVHDASRGTKSRVTSHPAEDYQSTWSPGGDSLIFGSRRNGVGDLFRKAVDGSGAAEPVVADAMVKFEPFWSADGKYLAYLSYDSRAADAPRSISYLPLTGENEPQPFLSTAFEFLLPSLSPDSRFVAYMSDRTGRFEIYVSRFPDGDETWGPISVEGGMHPKWSSRGKELFYVDPSGLMVVAFDAGDEFEWSPPRRLFTEEQVGAELYDWSALPVNVRYDVAPGGERFVVVQSEGDSSITVVQNWIAEFEDR